MKKLLLLSAAMFFVSMSAVFAQYNNGLIIANEGNFGTPNASVSYFSYANHQLTNGIYNAVNGEAVGDVLQNIGLHGNKAYLVVNNSDKVEVVNRTTFQKVATVTDGIMKPRYIAFSNGKYFVSNSANTTITIYDEATNNKLASVASESSVEKLITIGDKVFVMQAAFGSGNSVMVIDALNNTALTSITLAEGLQWIAAEGNKLYAICGSGSSHTDFFEIDATTHEIVRHLSSESYKAKSKMAIDNGVMYFVANGNEIYAMPLSADALPSTAVLTVADNSWSTCYGFNVIDGMLMESDAMGFTAPSQMSVYNTQTYTQMGSDVACGMGTNGFYKNVYGNDGLAESSIALLKLVPNPAQDYVSLQGVNTAVVEIRNANGQLCMQLNYQEGDAIEVSQLKAGVYLVVCKTSKATMIEKLVVQ